MADKYVASTGSNTSPYDTWAKAATDPTTAINAAAAGEKVYVHAETFAASANQTWTLAGTASSPVVVICSNDKVNAPPTTAGSGWTYNLGATGYDLTIAGIGEINKMTASASGGSTASILTVPSTDDDMIVLTDCTFNMSACSAAGCTMVFGSTALNNGKLILNNFSYVSSNNNNVTPISAYCQVDWNGGSVTETNTAGTNDLFSTVSHGARLNLKGVDLSGWATGDYFNISSNTNYLILLENCKLHSTTNLIAAFTGVHQGELTLVNCASDDTHYLFRYSNYLGTLTVDAATYANDGAEYNAAGSNYSWKIVTEANASRSTPFQTPWIYKWHEATSAITPYLEGLKASDTDSAADTTAQNDEVWGEFSVQATASSTKGTLDFSDRCAWLASAADQTSTKATTDWTIAAANDLYKSTFKLLGTSQTPAEIGFIMGRACFAEPEKTYFLDPQIRT